MPIEIKNEAPELAAPAPKKTPEAPTAKEHKRGGILTGILLIIIIVLGVKVFTLSNSKTPASNNQRSESAATVIDVMPISAQTVSIEKNYIGYVTPIHSVAVLPFISGFVEKIYVQNGQMVQSGDLLMTLEQGEYRAQLDEARASLMQAKANYENAATYFNRVQAAGAKAVSQADFDKAQANYLTSQAAVSQAQASLNAAQVMFDYTIIRAPITGRIGTIIPSKGSYVSPAGSALTSIIQTSPIQVVFSITDKDYITDVMNNGFGNLMAQQSIKIRLGNGTMYPYEGTFSYTDNSINKSTNSIAVYVNFDNPDQVLMANAYVDVILKSTYDGVLIDQSSTTLTPAGKMIWVADSRSVRQVAIDEIAPIGSKFLIRNTFKNGEYLVKGQAPKLSENQSFRLNIVSEK